MREFFFAAAAAAAVFACDVNGQVSGSSGTGTGTSAGTVQPFTPPSSSGSITTSSSPRPGVIGPQTSPAPGSAAVSPPRTSIDTPDATAGAVDPFRYSTPTIRRDGTVNDSRDWERGVGGPASGELGEDRRRLTPPSDYTPRPRPLGSASSTATTTVIDADELNSTGVQTPRNRSDLNTTGVNTPPRVPEQPLDRALSAKIRSQLSMTPSGGQQALRIAPETVRDMRITSQGGKVVLEGTVASEKEKEMIEFRAKEVQGVGNVENRLKVSPHAKSPAQGAPAGAQSRSEATTKSPLPTQPGQTPAKTSDLQDEHNELTPD